MSILVDALEDLPVLYGVTSRARKPDGKSTSHSNVSRSVKVNWSKFFKDYEPFAILRRGHELIELNASSGEDNDLNFDWAAFEEYRENHLIFDNWKRATEEYAKVSLHINRWSNWTDEYWKHVQGEASNLSNTEVDAIEDALPEELLRRFSDMGYDDIDAVFSTDISSYLVEDCLYPTPHAFRHMWAEAVYRRFDGDAGWMIKSNFKHISNRMWLAYIRDKDNRRSHVSIKNRVCSNLVNAWLSGEGKGYSGKFHKYLSCVISSTEVASKDNAIQLLKRIVFEEVNSITSNPWGFCIVRRSTEKFSRCAVAGSSRTENATPSLCMPCINYFGQKSNIDYIIFSSYQHVDLLLSELSKDIPEEFTSASQEFLEGASARIRELEPDHPILKIYNHALGKIDLQED
jgi:hypothetical protein